MRDGKFVVLCVDDDPDVHFTLRIVLEKSGYIMEEAQTAEEGLRKYKTAKPDFVLIDLMMEEVDSGMNLARQLQALGNKTPVYMLSSVGDQLNMTVSPKELDLSGFFQKPINPDTLLLTLKLKLQK